MSSVNDFMDNDTGYFTVCKCGAKITWTAKFSATLEELREQVDKLFGWELQPARCPNCKIVVEQKETE